MCVGVAGLANGLQWNPIKQTPLGEQPFGRYREVVFLEKFRLPAMYAL